MLQELTPLLSGVIVINNNATEGPVFSFDLASWSEGDSHCVFFILCISVISNSNLL